MEFERFVAFIGEEAFRQDSKFQAIMKRKQWEVLTFARNCSDWKMFRSLLQLESILFESVIFMICDEAMQCQVFTSPGILTKNLAILESDNPKWRPNFVSDLAPVLAAIVCRGSVSKLVVERCNATWVRTHFVSLFDAQEFILNLLNLDHKWLDVTALCHAQERGGQDPENLQNVDDGVHFANLSPLAWRISGEPANAVALAKAVIQHAKNLYWNRTLHHEARGHLLRWFNEIDIQIRSVGGKL